MLLGLVDLATNGLRRSRHCLACLTSVSSGPSLYVHPFTLIFFILKRFSSSSSLRFISLINLVNLSFLLFDSLDLLDCDVDADDDDGCDEEEEDFLLRPLFFSFAFLLSLGGLSLLDDDDVLDRLDLDDRDAR